jgi:hypothetical protein
VQNNFLAELTFAKSLPYLILGAVGLFVISTGYGLVSNLRDLSAKATQQEKTISLMEGRLESYKRMVDRRDDAINNSKCAEQIKDWVRNPDKLPPPFRPFDPTGKQ